MQSFNTLGQPVLDKEGTVSGIGPSLPVELLVFQSGRKGRLPTLTSASRGSNLSIGTRKD